VLNNPPVHENHAIGDATAWQMFTESRDVLQPGGELWVVGNRHSPTTPNSNACSANAISSRATPDSSSSECRGLVRDVNDLVDQARARVASGPNFNSINRTVLWPCSTGAKQPQSLMGKKTCVACGKIWILERFDQHTCVPLPKKVRKVASKEAKTVTTS
jgi:hypothetical protein